MDRRKMYVWRSIVLCFLGLSALVASGSLAFAHRGDEQRKVEQMRRMRWPTRYFAPYSNDASSEIDLVALSRASGARFFTLAFVEGSKDKTCQATWNTRQPIGSWMRDNIAALRARGGDVRVAFGGSANSELATVCNTLPDLFAQYQATIDAYGLSHLDFDIEGQTLKNSQATRLRNRAIAALQRYAARAGRQLNISYTLPVETTGLGQSSLNLLRNAIQDGVRVDVVNLMIMDYYSKNAPGDQMGQNAITAAGSVFRQLQQLYPAKSADQLWGMLGLTPMIGVNDHTREIFTLRDAQLVNNFAERQQMALVSFWSIRRDRSCTTSQTAPHGCSGIDQQPYDYAQVFNAFGE
ncbi:MAG TPA: chitinase [Ktedonobacteraceae bacterium]